MRIRVTAILVAEHGGEWLEQTLAGLEAQTRQADGLIAVINGGKDSVARQLSAQQPAARIIATQGHVSFGEAVRQAALTAETRVQADTEVQDWFWLLTEDSAPEPAALAEVLATVQRAPSVAVAGSKLVDWDQPDHIIELGQSLTQRGQRWLLRRQERDQQQYDHLQDVLGVGPVAMLVRADAWQALDGFDPAYPVYDDGLDFSVRARLAGYRVVVAPTSRVRFARRGVGGPRIDRSRRALRVAHRQARTAQLHRSIAYASGFAAFFMWLGLPFVAIGRTIWALIREQPGHLWAEFASALAVFVRPASIIASRKRVARANTSGWGAVNPLRVDTKSVRTARMIDREAILVSQGRLRRDMHFISSGGLAVLLASALASLGLTWWAITQTSLTGGALAPLSGLGDLWAATRIEGGVPADPLTWVLAVLGSLTFWNPSQGVVVMLVAAIPLASLGGWIWAAQLTESRAGRALLAIAWAFSPVLLGSLAAGRLPTLILAVVLPWLLLAATRCRESWSWSGITSLLAAIALACAPVLMPAAIVLWLIGFAGSGRGIARHVSTVIAPLVLFAPNLLALLAGASPLSLLRDPGITDAFVAGSPWHLLLGFPEFGLEGWGAIVAGVGLGAAPATLLVGVLLLPIVLLAAVGLITGKVHFTLLHAVLGGLGLITAVGSAQLQLSTEGTAAVSVWTGSGLALYWIAVLGLATVGTTVLRKAAAPIVAVGLVAALVVVSPLIVKLATASTEIAPGETQMPAIVQAAGAQDATLRTLVLTSLDETSVRAELLTGEGLRLDQVRTAAHVAEVTEQDEWVAQLVGMLAGTGGGDDIEAALIEHHVGFVLLRSDGDASARSNLQTAFDEHAVLQSAGQTDHGLLWRSAAVTVSEPESQQSLGEWFVGLGSGAFARMLWLAQAIVLGAMVLLALPTGEVVERPAQRRRRDGGASAAPATPVADGMAPVDGDGELVGAGAAGAPALGGEPVITTAVPEVAVAAEGAEVEAHEAEAEAHVAEAEQQSYGATASLAYPMDPAASMPPVVEFDDGDPPPPDAERPNEGGER